MELAVFLFTYFSSESPEHNESYYTSLERHFQGEYIQCRWNHGKWFRIDGEIPEISFMNMNLGGR